MTLVHEVLKPCPNPWCNSQRADRPEPYVYYYESGCYYRVRCDVCPQIGPSGETREEAIATWNTRASAEMEAENERLREALRGTEQALIAMYRAISRGDAETAERFAAADPAVQAARQALPTQDQALS